MFDPHRHDLNMRLEVVCISSLWVTVVLTKYLSVKWLLAKRCRTHKTCYNNLMFILKVGGQVVVTTKRWVQKVLIILVIRKPYTNKECKKFVINFVKTNLVYRNFIKYSVHFFTTEIMMKYCLRTILGRYPRRV